MTYKQAQEEYKKRYGITVKPCWIADIRRSHGKTTRKAWNRIGEEPKYPCPKDVFPKLEEILRALNMI